MKVISLVDWLDLDTLGHSTSTKQALQLTGTNGALKSTSVLNTSESDAMTIVLKSNTALPLVNPHWTV